MAEPDVLVINLLRHELGAAMAPYSRVSRLFRRHPDLRWSRPYSMIDDSIDALLRREPHWRVVDCPQPAILHDGYRPELLAGSDKTARLRKAMESELAAHPGDPYASAKLGGLLISEGKQAEAIPLLHSGLERATRPNGERYELLFHLDGLDAHGCRRGRGVLSAGPHHPVGSPRQPGGTHQPGGPADGSGCPG